MLKKALNFYAGFEQWQYDKWHPSDVRSRVQIKNVLEYAVVEQENHSIDVASVTFDDDELRGQEVTGDSHED